MIQLLSVLFGAALFAGGVQAGFDPSFSTPVVAFDDGKVYAGANRQASSWQIIADCSSASGTLTGVSVLADGLLVTADKEVRRLAAENMTGTTCGEVIYTATGGQSSLTGAWPSLDDSLVFVLDAGRDRVMMVNRSNDDAVTTEVRGKSNWDLRGLGVSEDQLFVSWRGPYDGFDDRSGFLARNASDFGNGDDGDWSIEFVYGSSQNWTASAMGVDVVAEKGYYVELRRDVDRMAVQSFSLPYYSGNLNSVVTGLDAERSPSRALAVDADSGYLWITSHTAVTYAKNDGTARGDLDVSEYGTPVGVAFIAVDQAFDYANAGSTIDDDGYLFDDDIYTPMDDDDGEDDDAVDGAPIAALPFQLSVATTLFIFFFAFF